MPKGNGTVFWDKLFDYSGGGIDIYEFRYKTNVYQILPYFLSYDYEGRCDKEFYDCQEKRYMIIL